MKRLYTFTLQQVEQTKVEEKSTDKNGAEITTTKEVDQDVDRYIILKKPNRRLFDDAELFYGVELSKGIKAGLLTRALLQKRFSNDGGTMGEKEREEYGQLYSDVFDKQVELQKLSLIDKANRTPEEQARYTSCQDFIREARGRIQEFEMQQSSLFDQTAENRARNRTILWWVLYLGYQINGEDEEETPFFGDGDYISRLELYDKMEEDENDWAAECINKFFYYVSFWYVSKTSDPQQFKDLIKFAEKEDTVETDVSFEGGEEETPKEEASKEEAPEENSAEEPSED